MSSCSAETLPECLESLAKRFGQRPAVITPAGHAQSYADFVARIFSIANGLGPRRRLERMAIVMPNGPEMSAALLAVMSVCVAVPFNPSYTEAEFAAYFAQAKIESLLVYPDGTEAARNVAKRQGIEVLTFSEASHGPQRRAPARPEDVAIILLTSGTTGRSKLVPLTHRNLVVGARNVAHSLHLAADDRVLSMWEQYHIGGVVDLLLAPLAAGSSIISAGGFDAHFALRLVEALRPTWFQGVPTTLRAFHDLAKDSRLSRSGGSLRFLRSVAAALPPLWMRDLEECFGVPVIQTFGMTEAAPLITSTRLPPATRKPNSTGLPCGTTVAVIDASGLQLPDGATGEVAVRGENVFAGYLGDEEANASAFRAGWFLTGDLGYIDADGELFLTGRKKDLINRGGEKISPYEVEEALGSHPAVEEAAVFAVAHPTLGEDIGAAIVLRRGSVATVSDIEAFASERLAHFKVPHRYLMLRDLPRSSVGKVSRPEVAALYHAQREQTLRREPENGLERALARIWADELDIETVGVDDLFVELGGDSLSSIRVLMAAESLLGIRMPEDAARHCTTVRAMGSFLLEMGCASEPPFSGSADSVKAAMLEATAKLQGHPINPSMLADSRSRLAFQAARHAAENVATPIELERMLAQRWLRFGESLQHPIATVQALQERSRVGRLLRASMRTAHNPVAWRREPLGENVDLFTSDLGHPSGKSLIVGFSSRAMRLTAPTYAVLCALDPKVCDLVLLRDPTRQHYLSGVAGIGGTIEAVSRWAGEFARLRGYCRVVALGTSSGGIPAICAALLNNWPRVLAVGADQPSRHLHLQELLAACAPLQLRAETDVVLAYSAHRKRDRKGAEEINAAVPAARQLPDGRFKDHALLYLLQKRGELASFLGKHLIG